MNKVKKILILYFTILSSLVLAQTREFKGLLVDTERQPIELFTIVVIDSTDTAKQLYGEVCNNGTYHFTLPINGNEECLIYSLGYKDIELPIDALLDTIVMENSAIKMKDVMVEGKRDVSSAMTIQGGILYDIENTVLSKMNTSTMLLNFIPGIRATDEGDVTVLGKNGNVVIYVDGIKLYSSNKLLSLKSEDIKSVEVIRNPGVKYKGAGAVILVKTTKTETGFGGRVQNAYTLGEEYENIAPRAEFNFNKSKVAVNFAYSYNHIKNKDSFYTMKRIDNNILPDNWALQQEGTDINKNSKHWYYSQVRYDISDKHLLSLEYAGGVGNGISNRNSTENIMHKHDETIYNETVLLDNNFNNSNNQIHLYYKGEITDNFNLELNVDYSGRIRKNNDKNNWNTTDLYTGQIEEKIFTQDIKSSGNAFTGELMLSNTIKEKHLLTYGVDYSYLHDNTSSTIEEQSSDYELTSNFINAYTDYNFTPTDKWNINAGVRYTYNLFVDNNASGTDYFNFTPNVSVNYYNQANRMGFNFYIEYKNFPPEAKWLDDVTVRYISPYRISTGNRSLTNSQSVYTSLTFNYKNLQIGLYNEHMTNALSVLDVVEVQDNGMPLFVNMPIMFKKPFNEYSVFTSYRKTINFWSFSVNGSINYSRCRVEQSEDQFILKDGFSGDFYMSHRFELPLKFIIFVDGFYKTRGQIFVGDRNASYGINFYLEKQFLNNQLNVFVKAGGLFGNKYNTMNIHTYGIETFMSNNTYGANRYHYTLNLSWRFNNYKKATQSKENAYLNMLK